MSVKLQILCPHCAAALKVKTELVGRSVRCPQCRQRLQIEQSSSKEGEAPGGRATDPTLGVDSSRHDTVGSEGRPSGDDVSTEKSFGRFELRRLLGQGGFGRVYLAFDPQLDREIALKLPIFAAASKKQMQRFRTEARAAAQLFHPHIVRLFESGKIDGQAYIVSEYVQGMALSEYLKNNTVGLEQAADWTIALSEALSYAHEHGVLHRDIKPHNVIVDQANQPQLLDFGLAKRLDEDSTATVEGAMLGTPAYMSPEQARGDLQRIGPHSDQYSLAAVLYQLITGEKPFSGGDLQIIAQLTRVEPAEPRSLNPDVPMDLQAICQKAMSKEIELRYGTVAEFGRDLRRWRSGRTVAARPLNAVQRLHRWRHRNPGLAVAVATATLLLLLTTITAFVGYRYTSSARSRLLASLGELEVAAQREQESLQRRQTAREQAEQENATLEKNLKLAEEQRALAEASQQEAEEAQRLTVLSANKAQSALSALERQVAIRENRQDSRDAARGDLSQVRDQLTQLSEDDPIPFVRVQLQVVRVQLQAAQDALTAEQNDRAIELLEQVPLEHRHWEWWFVRSLASPEESDVRPITVDRTLKYGRSNSRFSRSHVSPDGKWFIRDNRAEFIDLDSGTIFTPPISVQAALKSPFVFSPDGSGIYAIRDNNREVAKWDIVTGERDHSGTFRLTGPQQAITLISARFEGASAPTPLLVGSNGLFDLLEKREIGHFQTGKEPSHHHVGYHLNPANKLLAKFTLTGIQFINLESRDFGAQQYFGFTASVVDFDQQGEYFAAGTRYTDMVKVYTDEGDRDPMVLEIRDGFLDCCFDATGSRLLVLTEKNSIDSYDLATGAFVFRFSLNKMKSSPTEMLFDQTGKLYISHASAITVWPAFGVKTDAEP